jgi:radical SAM superfamily enzyme YgiQ (UPF0313 family)
MSSKIKRVTLLQPESAGGNFEYIAIPRQGLLFLSGALKQWEGPFLYDREVWFESRSGQIDPDKDLEGVDILMVSALINEAPRGYEVARLAKEAHPDLITIGGGPQMSPLPREAMELGKFDVIVNREGEDIVAQLCDVMLTLRGSERDKALSNIPGISYISDGQLVQTLRRGLVSPDFVELPDFHAIRDLNPMNPMAGGVLETVRGCTEKCTYCQVIQQFLGYRMVNRETEIKRLHQLQELAADGLIHSRNGRFAVFVSDDLHPPPLRATKYRNERLERIKAWKGHSDGMALVCQARAEVGQDPELAHALREIGMGMLYLGVESDNVANLEAVRKRQEPGQMFKDLETLNSMGFSVVAMTIIGLPFDTEESIMDMAEWVTQISRYQTANLLTPLPATSNWTDLTPLDENGNILAEGAVRPYHLYTGEQLVHLDERWTLQESQALFQRYYAKLNPVDRFYGRIFSMMQNYKGFAGQREFSPSISARISELKEALNRLSESTRKEIGDAIAIRVNDVGGALSSLSDQAMAELQQTISEQVGYMTETLDDLTQSSRAISTAVSLRMNEMSEALRSLSTSSPMTPALADE